MLNIDRETVYSMDEQMGELGNAEDLEQQTHQMEQDTKDLIQRLSKIEKQLEIANRSIVTLSESINDNIVRQQELAALWKRSIMESHGLTTKQVKLYNLDDEIIAMTRLGLTIDAQAEYLGVHRTTILNHRNKLLAQGKLERKPKGPISLTGGL